MFDFMKIKIYRKKFTTYFFFLLVLFIILSFILSRNVLQVQRSSFSQDVRNSFSQSEKNLYDTINKIEAYVQDTYADHALIEDMSYFLGHSAEEYQSKRLENSIRNSDVKSFVDDIRSFAASNGQKTFSKISVQSYTSANVFSLEGDIGSQITYGVSMFDELIDPNSDTEFVHSRKLISPSDMTQNIGELRFFINHSWVFSGFVQKDFDAVCVVNGTGKKDWLVEPSEKEKLKIEKKIDLSVDDISYSGVYNKYQIESINSENFDYVIHVVKYTDAFFSENMAMYIIINVVLFLTFILILVLIRAHLKEEASFLNNILQTISHAKKGEFNAIEENISRRNEYGIIAYELNDMCFELEEYIRKEFLLKLEQKETEMKALQNQINPHFLYNTLEIIRSMAVVDNNPEVADAIANLGKMFRDILQSDEVISMEEELQLLVNYLKIMEFRSQNNFFYQINFDPEVKKLETVKFWMQPFAENFFKHGFDNKHDFNFILINGRDEKDAYVIEIMDNGEKIEEEQLKKINDSFNNDVDTENIGVNNVYKRLKMFYGNKFSMTISNNDNAGVSIVVTIRKGEKEHGL